ncbi:MAG TPA: hemerythrin domain-containing protein [Candidatus Thermoplasmatota archaeon]|nr:hemerythrin domain-containing protein [Candidatus Thermoplasmatota archaeon]
MDAITLLKQDHDRVKDMLRQLEQMPAGQPEQRRALAEKIIAELMVHERIEEEIFYPAVEQAGKTGEEEVEHSIEEHELVDNIIAQLEEVDLASSDFEATVRVLKENVFHHIKDEEEKMFPYAQKKLAGKLDKLGTQMSAHKAQLEREMTREGLMGEAQQRANERSQQRR